MDGADKDQFTTFVVHRIAALYRYGIILTGNSQDAEDLVQEALVRTALAWRRVRRKDDPERYVRTTMVRLMMNRWRRPLREHPVAQPPDQAVADRGLARVEDDESFAVALAALPRRMRAVLVLRYVDDLSEAEIASALGCSTGTVKSQASRALARLRATLGPKRSRHG